MHNRKVVRTHQNVLVYYKGDTGNIQSHFSALEEITEENLPNGLDIGNTQAVFEPYHAFCIFSKIFASAI